ncbi:MAG: GvpL/GvpF family gas vesicle protein [Rhizobacter sp.]|nr:GvpL/GvpF family gas vesicle protein [Chlorobiales bacterium]
MTSITGTNATIPVAAPDTLILICALSEHPPPEAEGMFAIESKEVFAAARRASASEYAEIQFKENLKDVLWTEREVRRHEAAVEAMMRRGTVIPFKFPTLFTSEENVQAFIDQNRAEIKRQFQSLYQKTEWGVKIFWNGRVRETSPLLRSERLRQLDAEIETAAAGKAFFLRKKKDELMSGEIRLGIEALMQESLSALHRHSDAVHLSAVLPQRATGRTDEMIFNAAFLVAESAAQTFREALNLLTARLEEENMIAVLTGPWPPYHFCGIASQPAANQSPNQSPVNQS